MLADFELDPWGQAWAEKRMDARFEALLAQLTAVKGLEPDLEAIKCMVNPFGEAAVRELPAADRVKQKIRMFNAGMAARRR